MEKETALPKNVRQIGDISGNHRVYLEDYVATYIRKKEKLEEKKGFLGIFLGEMQKTEDQTRLFIRGLMDIAPDRWERAENVPEPEKDTPREISEEKAEVKGEAKEETETDAADTPQKSEKTKKAHRRTVQEESRDYFDGMEILGCCVVGRYPVELMKRLVEEVPQSRRLLYHLQEQEEHLYWDTKGKYEEISGYFVFYEQNRCMQEYMQETAEEPGEQEEKIRDQAIRVFREKIRKKDQMHAAGLMKLAGSFFVVTVLIAGAVVVTRMGNTRDTASDGGIITASDHSSSGLAQRAAEALDEQEAGLDLTVAEGTALSGTAAAGSAEYAGSEEAVPSAGTGAVADGGSAAAGSAEYAGSEAVVSSAGTGAVTDGGSMASDLVEASAGTGAVADSGSVAAGSAEYAGSEEAVSSAGTGAVADSGSVAAGSAEYAGSEETMSSVGTGAAADSGSVAAGSAEYVGSEETMSSVGTGAAADGGSIASGSVEASAGTGAASNTGSDEAGAFAEAAVSDGYGAQEDVEASAQIRRVRASYVIREGDTLADICQKYYGSINRLEELCLENGIEDADLILPGQKIVLP